MSSGSNSSKAFMLKEGFPQMYRIVCCMLSRPESAIFREPVDWKALQLTDYLDIVKKPMDLGTIKKKIEDDKYSTKEEIAADIRLVWWNCMLYNRDGSEFYHLADTFSKGFEAAYKALQDGLLVADTSSSDPRQAGDIERIPTVEEKMQLSYDIFKINNSDMARVLTMIEKSCPSALSRKVSTDEVLLNFDAMTPRCFHEVNEFVVNCTLHSSKKNKKKRPLSSGSNLSAVEAEVDKQQ